MSVITGVSHSNGFVSLNSKYKIIKKTKLTLELVVKTLSTSFTFVSHILIRKLAIIGWRRNMVFRRYLILVTWYLLI